MMTWGRRAVTPLLFSLSSSVLSVSMVNSSFLLSSCLLYAVWPLLMHCLSGPLGCLQGWAAGARLGARPCCGYTFIAVRQNWQEHKYVRLLEKLPDSSRRWLCHFEFSSMESPSCPSSSSVLVFSEPVLLGMKWCHTGFYLMSLMTMLKSVFSGLSCWSRGCTWESRPIETGHAFGF